MPSKRNSYKGKPGGLYDESPEAKLGKRAVISADGCWIVDGKPDKYAILSVGGVSTRAHRFTYETFVGPIPEGMIVHHRCEHPGCINPKHLYLLTNSVHMKHHHWVRHNEEDRKLGRIPAPPPAIGALAPPGPLELD